MPIDPLAVFGRGAIVADGHRVPGLWEGVASVKIDASTLAAPQAVVEQLHGCWAARQPIVIDLLVDPAAFRVPLSITGEPWTHSPQTEPWFDRLHFLVWANNYDCRGDGAPVWWWARKASRLLPGSAVVELEPGATSLPIGDVLRTDGSPVWVDGGPRQPWDPTEVGSVVHAESVEAGRAVVMPTVGDPGR